MKNQGYNSRLDESLGARNGKKSQSMKSRRNESKGMMKHFGEHPYSADPNMKQIFMAKDKNFIQNVFQGAKRRGTLGDCTGKKYGSSSCPPGSKKYNFAKTMRKINKSK